MQIGTNQQTDACEVLLERKNMQITNWTQPIKEEIRQAEVEFAKHRENYLKYMEITKTLDCIINYDEYWKFMGLAHEEQHACGLAEYRIKALRYDMNYDLGYYDIDNDNCYKEETDDNE